MKIIHILPPLTKGGAERVAVDLGNHAARHGHEVAIVASYPVAPELLFQAIDQRVKVTFVSRRPLRFAKYLALAGWLTRNRTWLLEQDVVHCHLTFGAVAGSLLKLIRRLSSQTRPIIIETYHAVGMPIPVWKRGLAALLARHREGLVLMASDDFWDRFAKNTRKVHVRVIANGIAPPADRPSPQEIAAFRSQVGIAKHDLVVGTVGRLVEGRMPLRMIDVFGGIARLGGPGIHFLMAGEGNLLDACREHARMLGLTDRLHFTGLITRPVLAFAMIDVYVSINVGPITGIAGLEAAISGKPVIALQTRGDYHAGAEDWIWSSSDPDQVAIEAVRLLNDAEARKRLATAQEERVRTEYSDAAMASAYAAFYGQCLEGR